MTLLLPYGPYAGVNGPLLRRAAEKLADMGSAKLYDLAVVLGVSPAEAKPTWEQLVAEGFIEGTPEGARPTERMDALAHARFGKPLSRKKAEALVKKAVAAAKALNTLPPEAPYYWITRLAVFGSYLDDQKSELGDLDLAWEVEQRPGVRGHAHMAIMYNRDGLQTTRAQVCPKGPYIRLTSFGELLSLKCPYQEVYTFASEDLAKARAEEVAKLDEYRRTLAEQFPRFSSDP
jgi:predicted nucleotidyltransferase